MFLPPQAFKSIAAIRLDDLAFAELKSQPLPENIQTRFGMPDYFWQRCNNLWRSLRTEKVSLTFDGPQGHCVFSFGYKKETGFFSEVEVQKEDDNEAYVYQAWRPETQGQLWPPAVQFDHSFSKPPNQRCQRCGKKNKKCRCV